MFKITTYGRGGVQGDPVIACAQDDSDYDNSRFVTAPDGKKPWIQMHVWGARRDSDFDSSVIIHEFTHGISTRLTGGALDLNCLKTFESTGLGEIWGDVMFLMFRVKAGDNRDTKYVVGDFVRGEDGVRR